jgi:hypothetical protein
MTTIVRLPDLPVFFDVLAEHDMYVELRNRDTDEEFVVSRRTFREFVTVTHPSTRKKTNGTRNN